MALLIAVLVDYLRQADLPQLMDVCGATHPSEVPGCKGLAVRDLRAALGAGMARVVSGGGWDGQEEARGTMRAMLRLGGARLAWEMAGGEARDFVEGEALWVAGPAGLACWGGGWVEDADLEGEGMAQILCASWDEALTRLRAATGRA